MDDDKNARRFSHVCRYGITVRAERCDLRGGVTVVAPSHATETAIAAAVAQAMGYHACVIHPELSSFGGYDGLDITIERQ